MVTNLFIGKSFSVRTNLLKNFRFTYMQYESFQKFDTPTVPAMMDMGGALLLKGYKTSLFFEARNAFIDEYLK